MSDYKIDKDIEDSLAETEIESTLAATQSNALSEVESMYAGTVDTGTEEVGREDLNTPILKIIQSNSTGIENKKEGYFFRSDTKEQLKDVDVNFVYVTTTEQENYNKTATEKVKLYYGFYADTNEPFKMFVRGWSMAGHREFQSEVAMLKAKFKVPMFALKATLTTELKKGDIKETGKPYEVHKLVCKIVKDPKDKSGIKPVVEMDPDRINFLFSAASKFKKAAEVEPTEEVEESTFSKDKPF